jgi:hypothetical protein
MRKFKQYVLHRESETNAIGAEKLGFGHDENNFLKLAKLAWERYKPAMTALFSDLAKKDAEIKDCLNKINKEEERGLTHYSMGLNVDKDEVKPPESDRVSASDSDS